MSLSSTAFIEYHSLFHMSTTFFKNFQIYFFRKNRRYSIRFLLRRRRDLNPRAAINDLLPFQGSPFSQLGYFSIGQTISKSFIKKTLAQHPLIKQTLDQSTERVGFEPTRPFGQTVFKTASL